MSGEAVNRRSPLGRRQAGVLLHPTSLPGPWICGDLGAEAYHFVDFLADAGFSVWQILPIGPTNGGSPYQCFSAHGGNPQLISIEKLAEWGWLPTPVFPIKGKKNELLHRAYAGFRRRNDPVQQAEFVGFVGANSRWLEDFALYSALKFLNDEKGWTDWPSPLRDRDPVALEEARRVHAPLLDEVRFEQFAFFRQWQELKEYAHRKGVMLFGDMPIFVAHDSADVWAQRHYFQLDTTGQPTVVAGVPPDYFSATGQRWGNPHYDWQAMEADHFRWWVERVEGQIKLFDLVRVDHFRGFESYWEVPAREPTAMRGRWVKAPGDQLFAALHERFDPLPIVAEDLGIITDEVVALRDKWALPGMKILHFAFDGGANNPYLPHQHLPNFIAYTGTHDNDTTVGWFSGLSEGQRAYVLEYLGYPEREMPWPLITAAYQSVARLAVVPMQDLLGLGSDHRMNTPGTETGNWQWRFDWEQLPAGLGIRLRRLAEIYGRLA